MKLGLIKRMFTDFNNASALKTLYYSLVWSYTDSILQNQCLTSIQNNFLRYLCYKYGIQRTPYSGYDDLNILNSHFKIISLNNRFRLPPDLKFLFKLLHNYIDCPEHVERLNIKINSFNSRNKPIFYLSNSTNTYKMYSPANKLMSAGNSVCNINLFHT